MELGQRIRKLRLEHRLSLQEVAERTRLAACFLARMEHGEEVPSFETLESVAAALGVPLYQLFFLDGKLPPTPRLSPRLTLEQVADEVFSPELSRNPAARAETPPRAIQRAYALLESLRMRTISARLAIRLAARKSRSRGIGRPTR